MIDWINQYYENVPFFVLTVFGYIYLAITSKDIRKKLVYPVLLLLFLLLNPYLFKVVYNRTRYWRWFWNIPNVYVIAAAFTSLIKEAKKIGGKIACFCVILISVIFVGSFFYQSDSFVKTENPYKIDQEIVDVCNVILEENSSPMCLMDYPLHMRARQVSGEILTLYGRDANGYIIRGRKLQHALYEAVRNFPTDYEYILNAAQEGGCDFITLQKPRYIPDEYQQRYHYKLFYDTENYAVYQHVEDWAYDRVIILGVDGAGAFFRDTDTPEFDRIFADGNITYEMVAPPPTSSAQGWGSMLYGVESRVHGLVNDIVMHKRYSNQQLSSIVSLVKDRYPDSAAASIVSWWPINYGILESREDVTYFPDDMLETTLSNEEVVAKTKQWVLENDPKLLFVQFDSVDEAGHAYGYGSEEYYEAIREVDVSIGEIYSFLESNGLLENTLFIVTVDHGGTAEKTHGGDSPEETQCMFAIKGRDVCRDTEIKDMELRDIASIVLFALDVDKPKEQTSRIPEGIWFGVGGGERPENIILVTDSDYRGHISEPTPSQSFSKDLSEQLVYLNHFDEEEDSIEGEGYLVPGYFDSALDCEAGYCNTEIDLSEIGDKVSFAFWINAGTITQDPVIMTNKDWSSGRNPGFAIIHWDKKILINLADAENNRYDYTFPLPSDYWKGWTHFIFTFDLEKREVTGYCDFQELYSVTIPEQIDLNQVITEDQIVIGQDITGAYSNVLDAALDEVCIFSGILSEREIELLRSYYTD